MTKCEIIHTRAKSLISSFPCMPVLYALHTNFKNSNIFQYGGKRPISWSLAGGQRTEETRRHNLENSEDFRLYLGSQPKYIINSSHLVVSLTARQLATLAIHDITDLPPAPIQDSGIGVHPQGERQLIALFRYLWPQSTSQIFPLENLLTVLFNNSFKKMCAKKGVTNVNTGLLNYVFFGQ